MNYNHPNGGLRCQNKKSSYIAYDQNQKTLLGLN